MALAMLHNCKKNDKKIKNTKSRGSGSEDLTPINYFIFIGAGPLGTFILTYRSLQTVFVQRYARQYLCLSLVYCTQLL